MCNSWKNNESIDIKERWSRLWMIIDTTCTWMYIYEEAVAFYYNRRLTNAGRMYTVHLTSCRNVCYLNIHMSKVNIIITRERSLYQWAKAILDIWRANCNPVTKCWYLIQLCFLILFNQNFTRQVFPYNFHTVKISNFFI